MRKQESSIKYSPTFERFCQVKIEKIGEIIVDKTFLFTRFTAYEILQFVEFTVIANIRPEY